MLNYLQNHVEWSQAVFGEGENTEGILKHIVNEVNEVSRDPSDIFEWCDIIILAIDGATRMGFTPEELEMALKLKQAVNSVRKWPEPVPGKPTEHVDFKEVEEEFQAYTMKRGIDLAE